MLIYNGVHFRATILLYDAVSCRNYIASVINDDHVALADGYWQGNTKLLLKKTAPLPLCTPYSLRTHWTSKKLGPPRWDAGGWRIHPWHSLMRKEIIRNKWSPNSSLIRRTIWHDRHRNLKQWHIVTFLVSTASEAVVKLPLCSY